MTERKNTTTTSLDARVSSIERDVEHLTRGLDDIDRKIDRNHQSLHVQIQDLAGSVSRHSQVSWPLVVSVFVAILTGVSLMGGGLIFIGNLAIKPLQVEDQWMRERLRNFEEPRLPSAAASRNFSTEQFSLHE